jgi:capsular polysaccharide transport system permease protein
VPSLSKGFNVQVRVVQALMIRELVTRFGRENIGFLWVMAEPLLFAVLVGILWRYQHGPEEHGVGVVAFVASGYIPLVMFRSSVSRAVGSFTINSNLMYHRQVHILDLVLVRFFVEFLGHLMAYVFIACVLIATDQFPVPDDLGLMLLGWTYYALFTLSLCMVIAPLSEMSEVLEKFMPVTTYMMVPFSGAFFMVSWLAPGFSEAVLWSPPVHAMEMMRSGIFGSAVSPHYEFFYPLAVSMTFMAAGLVLCRRVRKTLVIE